MSQEQITVLFTEQMVQRKVRELANKINRRFRGQSLIVIGVLKGGFIFCSDLVRLLEVSVFCDFCRVSSYGMRDTPSEKIQLIENTALDISNKNVLLVEDIVDRGTTLKFLYSVLKSKKPHSLTTMALVVKPQTIANPISIDYIGFSVKRSTFVVGYGMDYQEQFRNLPYLAKVDRKPSHDSH